MAVDIFQKTNQPRDIFEMKPRDIFNADLSYMTTNTPPDEVQLAEGVQQSFSFFSDEERAELISKGKIGMAESFQRQNKWDLAPFSTSGIVESGSVLNAVRNLQANEYGDDIGAKQRDEKIFVDFGRKMEEERIREFSFGGKFYNGVSVMPAFMAEFWLTGGAAAVGKAVAKKAIVEGVGVAAKKGIQKFAEKAGRVAIETGVQAGVRAPFMFNHYIPKYKENQIFSNIAVTDKGADILKEGNETPLVSAVRAGADIYIEVWSESLGGAVFQPVGGAIGSKLSKSLSPEVKAGIIKFMNVLTAKNKLAPILTRAGFNGVIEEMGEEVVGDELRAAFGVESFGAEDPSNPLDRMASAIPGWEDVLVMAGMFSVPGAVSYNGKRLYDRLRERGMNKEQIMDVHENTSEKEKDNILNDLLTEENEWLSTAITKAYAGKELSIEEQYGLNKKFKEYVDKGWIESVISEEVISINPIEKVKAIEEVDKAINISKEKPGIIDPLIEEVKKYETFGEFEDAILTIGPGEKYDLLRDHIINMNISLFGDTKKQGDIIAGQEVEQVGVEEWKKRIKSGERPVVIYGTYGGPVRVIDGHHRLQAYKELGFTEIPTFLYSDLEDIWNKSKPKITRQQKYDAMVLRIAEIKKYKIELGEKSDIIKETLVYLTEQRKKFHNKIKRYKDGYLDEEYNELPSYYRGTKGETLDSAATQAGFEGDMAFRDYLIQLEKDYAKAKEEYSSIQDKIKEEIQRKEIQSEISSLKRRVSDFKEGKSQAVKDIGLLQTEISKEARKILPVKELGKVMASIKNINKESDVPEAMAIIIDVYEKYVDKLKRIKAYKEIIKDYKHPENVLDVKYQEKIDVISQNLGETKGEKRKSLNQMTTDQLVDLAREISSLRETGKKEFGTQKEMKMMASEIMRAATIKAAGGTIDIQAIGSQEEQLKAGNIGIKGGIKRTVLEWERPLRMIRDLFGEFGEKMFYDSLDRAEILATYNKRKRLKDISDYMKKNKVSMNEIGKTIEIDETTFQVNNVMTFYAQRNNKEAREALIHGNNINEELFEKFIRKLKEDYPNIVEVVDEVKEIVGDRYEEIRDTMNDVYNISLPKVTDYFPMSRRRLDIESDPDPMMALDLLGDAVIKSAGGINYATIEKGFTITRQQISERNQKPISIDFMEDAARAIDSQEHFIHYAHIQKIFNDIKSDPGIRNAVIYNSGESSWDTFNRYAEVAVNPRMMFKGLGYFGQKVKAARRAVGVYFLGFNLITTMKQFPAAHLALQYTNIAQLYKSMYKVLTDKKYREHVMEMDPAIPQRNMDRDINEIVHGAKKLPINDYVRQLRLWEDQIGDLAMQLIVNSDRWTAIAVYDSVYQSNRRALGEKKAMAMAHKAVLETQAQGRTIDLPEAYRTNDELMRMMMLFSNQLNQIWNIMMHDVPREFTGGEKKKAMLSLSGIMLNSLMLYVIQHGGKWPDDDEEQWKAWFEATLAGYLSSVPILGNMIMTGISGFSTSILPIEAIIDNMKNVFNKYQDEKYIEATVDLLGDIAVMAGIKVPVTQIKRTIKGMNDLYSGESEDFRRLIWSKSGLYE